MKPWRRRLTLVTVGVTAVLGAAAGQAVAAPPSADDVQPQVVGGTPAAQGEFPWAVRVTNPNGGLCTGTLITEQLVLTARHCTTTAGVGETNGYTITLGSVDLQDPNRLTVRSNFVQRPASADDDWALVRLERVVDLPALPLTTTPEYDNGTFTIAGWGAAAEGGPQQRFLLKAEVPFIDDAQCGSAGGIYVNLIPEKEICAGNWDSGGVDTCQGDSGGPMFRRDNAGEWILVGITSWGFGCARPRNPGVYVQVSNFAQDILAAAAALGPRCGRATSMTATAIPDPGEVATAVDVTCDGTASNKTTVLVNISHPYRGDLIVDLVAPDGTVYRLKSSKGDDSADNVNDLYTVNASNETATGTWQLRVRDIFRGDAGALKNWKLTV
jgi:secreted trypsin-like serine protease